MLSESTGDLTAHLTAMKEVGEEVGRRLAEMQEAYDDIIRFNATAADKVESINHTLIHIEVSCKQKCKQFGFMAVIFVFLS